MSSSCHLPPARGWLCWECYPEELFGSAQVFPAGSSVPKPVPLPRTKNISHRALRSSGAAEGCSGGLISLIRSVLLHNLFLNGLTKHISQLTHFS